MLRRFTGLSALTVMLGISLPLAADVRLPAIFSEHMVLQRDQPIPVWGWAAPNEQVTVSLNGRQATTSANDQGRWSVRLEPFAAGGPYELTVTGSNALRVQDVLVGEVWLCSGQSNMAMTVNRALNFEQEQRAAVHPRIRQFKTPTRYEAEPAEECEGAWAVCGPGTVAGFSATAYFFAREIERALDCPVGIVNSSVGGTPIEAWISESAQRDSPALQEAVSALDAARKAFDPDKARAQYERQLDRYREEVRSARAEGKPLPRAPRDPVAQFEKKSNCGGLFNGMIAPLIAYGFRGALWYQGEANSAPTKASLYCEQLQALVTDWRTRHGQGEFPVAWVQLPNYRGAGRNWPLIREEMQQATQLPGTGMAVTIDIGETADIHPRNKQEVGRRLSLWALGEVYGRTTTPVPHRVAGTSVTDGELLVSLKPSAPLRLDEGDSSMSFAAVAGLDRQWKPARVRVLDDGRIAFSSPNVPQPIAVRYQWANDPSPRCIRTNAGLPISPFRTDDWESVVPFDQLAE